MGYYITDNGVKHELDLNETHLFLTSMNIVELNLDGMRNLKYLSCWNNRITELNLSGLKLINLYCHYNNIKNLNIDGLKKLENMWCDNDLIDEWKYINSNININIIIR